MVDDQARKAIGKATNLNPSHRLVESKCPHCGYKLDAASSMTMARKPQPDDITICISCGNFLIFNLDLTLSKPDDEVEFLLSLPDDLRIQMVQLRTLIHKIRS